MGKIRNLWRTVYLQTRIPLAKAQLHTSGRPNAVFLWIPKTAGTSLYNGLNALKLRDLDKVKYAFPNRGLVTFGHMDFLQLVAQGYVSKDFADSSYKFAFVRDPYDRAVSLFHYLQKEQRLPESISFLEFLRNLQRNGCEPVGLYNSINLSQCNPQTHWLKGIDVDFLGRFENLEEDTATLFSKLGLDYKPLPMKNRGSRRRSDDYYCPESRQIVDTLYQEDFDTFGYDRCS